MSVANSAIFLFSSQERNFKLEVEDSTYSVDASSGVGRDSANHLTEYVSRTLLATVQQGFFFSDSRRKRQTFSTLKADRREVFKVLNMAGYSISIQIDSGNQKVKKIV